MRSRTLMLTAGLVLAVGLALVSGCEKDAPAPRSPATGPGAAVTAGAVYANTVCPIMTQNKIDPKNVPPNLVREFQGKKVAFCCPACPTAWDKLTDADKEAKLAKASPAD